MLTGSARVTQEANDAAAALSSRQEIERQQRLLQRKKKLLEAQVAALQLDLETEEQESRQLIAQEKLRVVNWEHDRSEMAKSRFGNNVPKQAGGRSAKGRERQK
jgi:circadian clock protein KaiC